MTDDGESQQTNANPGTESQVEDTPALTYGWGVPKGRTICSGCGARGVNIRTCPGDDSPHLPTTEYVDRSQGGERPSQEPSWEGSNGRAPTPNPPEVQTVIEPQEPDLGSLVWDGVGRDPEDTWDGRHSPQPARPLQVSTVMVRLATTYPALAAGRLEAFIEESLDECLWLETVIRETDERTV